MIARSFGCGRPSVAFTAGIHGNERTAMRAAAMLIEFLEQNPLRGGSVRVLPEVNGEAAAVGSRVHPADGLDLNRLFPGDRAGGASERLAAEVWQATADADFLVDLHDCAPGTLPHVLSVYSEGEALRRLCAAIPLEAAVHSAGTPGQLFVEAWRRRGQPAAIVELPAGTGPDGVDAAAAALALEAMASLLRRLGMLDGSPSPRTPAFLGENRGILRGKWTGDV